MRMNTVNSNTMGFKAFFDDISKKEATENDILGFLAGKGLSMFFKFTDKNTGKDHLYGSNEDDRIAYSIMKNPRKEDPVDKYEYFGGVDLEAALKDPSNMQQRPFTKADIKNIHIIEDKKDVAKELAKIKDAKVYIPYEDSSSPLADKI
jgi:hypothetical protein